MGHDHSLLAASAPLSSAQPPARQVAPVSATLVWKMTRSPSRQLLVRRVWPGSTGLENLTWAHMHHLTLLSAVNLDCCEPAGVATRPHLQDLSDGDAQGAQPVQDRGRESSERSKVRIYVKWIQVSCKIEIYRVAEAMFQMFSLQITAKVSFIPSDLTFCRGQPGPHLF